MPACRRHGERVAYRGYVITILGQTAWGHGLRVAEGSGGRVPDGGVRVIHAGGLYGLVWQGARSICYNRWLSVRYSSSPWCDGPIMHDSRGR